MIKKYLSEVITLGFLGLFIWYGVNNAHDFAALGRVGIIATILIAIGRLVVFLSNGLFTKWTAEAFTEKMSVGEGAYVSILSAVGNFFGPLLGGTSIRAVYLKKYHNLSYSKFTATLMGYYLILFVANSLMALGSLLWLPHTHQTDSLLLFFGAWLLALIALTFVRLPKKRNQEITPKNKFAAKLAKILYEIGDGWNILVKDKQLMAKLAFLALLSLVAGYFVSYVEFHSLHIAMTAPALGLYTAIVAVSLLLSLTPGAIGIRETLLIVVATTMGITNNQILQVAVLDRVITFGLLFILFGITRSRRMRKLFTKRDIQL